MSFNRIRSHNFFVQGDLAASRELGTFPTNLGSSRAIAAELRARTEQVSQTLTTTAERLALPELFEEFGDAIRGNAGYTDATVTARPYTWQPDPEEMAGFAAASNNTELPQEVYAASTWKVDIRSETALHGLAVVLFGHGNGKGLTMPYAAVVRQDTALPHQSKQRGKLTATTAEADILWKGDILRRATDIGLRRTRTAQMALDMADIDMRLAQRTDRQMPRYMADNLRSTAQGLYYLDQLLHHSSGDVVRQEAQWDLYDSRAFKNLAEQLFILEFPSDEAAVKRNQYRLATGNKIVNGRELFDQRTAQDTLTKLQASIRAGMEKAQFIHGVSTLFEPAEYQQTIANALEVPAPTTALQPSDQRRGWRRAKAPSRSSGGVIGRIAHIVPDDVTSLGICRQQLVEDIQDLYPVLTGQTQ